MSDVALRTSLLDLLHALGQSARQHPLWQNDAELDVFLETLNTLLC